VRWTTPVPTQTLGEMPVKGKAARTLDGGKPTDLPVVQATNPHMPFAALHESAFGT